MNMKDDQSPAAPKPRTVTVLAMLAGVALLVSWLWAYPLTGALISAGLLSDWAGDSDPRMLWMVQSFLAMLAGLILLGGLVRFLSARQLRKIDEMAEE